jgi:hypothetical protein
VLCFQWLYDDKRLPYWYSNELSELQEAIFVLHIIGHNLDPEFLKLLWTRIFPCVTTASKFNNCWFEVLEEISFDIFGKALRVSSLSSVVLIDTINSRRRIPSERHTYLIMSPCNLVRATVHNGSIMLGIEPYFTITSVIIVHGDQWAAIIPRWHTLQ